MVKARAAILREYEAPLSIEDVEVDPPKADEVLVKIAAAGVCHSDYHIMKGEWRNGLPMILGHEASGIVAEVGPGVTGLEPGIAVPSRSGPGAGAAATASPGGRFSATATTAACAARCWTQGHFTLTQGCMASRPHRLQATVGPSASGLDTKPYQVVKVKRPYPQPSHHGAPRLRRIPTAPLPQAGEGSRCRPRTAVTGIEQTRVGVPWWAVVPDAAVVLGADAAATRRLRPRTGY